MMKHEGEKPHAVWQLPKLDKKAVFAAFKDTLEKSLGTLGRNIEETKQRARDAPGAMQSHHDTTKKELSGLSESLENTLQERTESLARASQYSTLPCFSVQPGALVSAISDNGISVYFILPGGEGTQLEVNGAEILVISPTASLFDVMAKKIPGQSFNFCGIDYDILTIQ